MLTAHRTSLQKTTTMRARCVKIAATMALATLAAAFCTMLPANAQQAYADDGIAMHRLYNPNSDEHFYTSNEYEKENVIDAGWRDEGVGWYAVEEGAPVEDVQTSRERILRFTNTCRAEAGAKPLVLDEALTAVAQARAEEIAESGQKSHVRPDGRKWHTILTDNWIFVTEAAENLCGGFTSAAGACRAWKISPGHYSNMVSGKYKKLGVGVAQSETGYYHWVQLFTD